MIKFNARKNTNKNNIIKLINIEVSSINSFLDCQKTYSKQILVFFKNFMSNIDVDSILSDEITKLISDASNYLSLIHQNIALYNNLLDILDNLMFNLDSLDYSNIINKISKYNKKLDSETAKILKNNFEIEQFIHSMLMVDISEYISVDNLDILDTISDDVNSIATATRENQSKEAEISTDKLPIIENTLNISQITGLVTLPYKISDLRKAMRKNPGTYSSLSDVVEKLYTIPLANYKVTSVSRFKEAYKLIVEREHGTKKDALKLAIELFSNYNLHPAIITACKTLDELDVYLSCLEFNELEDFHFFKIIYEGFPILAKNRKKQK